VRDVLVVGAGPAGRAVAAACAERGLDTALTDPSPGRPWRATYGAWTDELPADLPDGVVAARAHGVVHTGVRRRLDREYAVLDVPALRSHLDTRLAAAGVPIEQGRAGPDARGRAAVVIDAGGAGQPLSRPRTGVPAEQTAFGLVVPDDVALPLAGPGEAVFMDWRPAPGTGPDDWPTFLYAVPLGAGRVLLEETSLARRPGLPIGVLEARLRARLAAHGIRPAADAAREVVRFPLDTPRHRADGVLGFGAAAPLTHPATGYQLATALRAAPAVAGALAAHWAGGPDAALRAAIAVLWPARARATHLLRRRALESLLRMPPALLPEFFAGFFTLPAGARDRFLDGRSHPVATAAAMARLFGTTPWPVRVRLIGGFVSPRAVPGYADRSNQE
jgi:lycopene beta-cyclase